MARRRDPLGLPSFGVPLNLTPLLDVIFNLLFFFMLSTTIRQKERFLDMTLPASSTAESRAVDKRIPEIVVDREGRIFFEDDYITLPGLEAKLTAAVRREGFEEVVLSIDGELAWQRIIDVTDVCRKAGVRTVTPRTKSETR
ncbi:biopolymer transporter ExbD [Candidatus Poribacteria bacterium]|nr:biopolymer transporter ExbD [Candidatus Poribacteria bacterium]